MITILAVIRLQLRSLLVCQKKVNLVSESRRDCATCETILNG